MADEYEVKKFIDAITILPEEVIKLDYSLVPPVPKFEELFVYFFPKELKNKMYKS